MKKMGFTQGILTELYPLLAIQFDEKKNGVKASDIFIKTFYDERPFFWKCPNCNFEWVTSLYSRLKNNTAWSQQKCSECYKGPSFPQLAILLVLSYS